MVFDSIFYICICSVGFFFSIENHTKKKKLDKKSPHVRAWCMHFTEGNWILDDAEDQTLYSDFLMFHLMMMRRKSMVHWNFDAHDILENMAQYINSFDILGNGTWFFAVRYVHGHR